MNKHVVSNILLWVVFAAAVVGGMAMYRYFRIPPELRFAEIEARWHLFVAALIALLAAALLAQRGTPRVPKK